MPTPSASTLSRYPELWVMLRPRAAYSELALDTAEPSRWMAIRRPLLLAFVCGCAVSLMTSGRVTLRLTVPAMLYFTFVPLIEIAALAVVRSRSISLARAIDLFFMGHAPWPLWLTGFAAAWAFLPAMQVFATLTRPLTWYAPVLLVLAWSAYIDFWFLRCVFERTPARALRDLTVQRLLTWAGVAVCFAPTAAWQVTASFLHL
jgi:hypothetical protein